MLVIPTIRLRNKRVHRAFCRETQHNIQHADDPVFLACLWAREGADRLYLIDEESLDTGKMQNLSVIERVVKESPVPVQVGGGVRDNRVIRTLKNRDVYRIVIGMHAVENRKFIRALCKSQPEETIVAIEAAHGFVLTRNQKSLSDLRAIDFMKELEEIGVQEMIYTDLSDEVQEQGPNMYTLETLLTVLSTPLILGGGMMSLAMLGKLKDMSYGSPLHGVLLEEALYDGRIDVSSAKATLDERRAEHV